MTIALQQEAKPEGGTIPVPNAEEFWHDYLTVSDQVGNVIPHLATELPSQDKGTWTVAPDGSMTTTYALRPNIYWHDGTPLTAQDFEFSWRVGNDRSLAIQNRATTRLINRVETPDNLTLVFYWSAAFPLADRISTQDMMPLPRHLLGDLYESDKEAFQRHAFWGANFVGVGPYQLSEWVPGSHVVAQAFDRFYLGKPKIDTITFKFITDEQTTIANLVSGAVDGQLRGLDFQQVLLVKDELEKRGTKPYMVVQPTFHRMIRPQYDERIQNGQGPDPKGMSDVRIRRGLLTAIDRQTLADTVYPGYGVAADTMMPSDDAKYDWVKDVVTQYPYDQRRAQQMLTEAGWVRGGDGIFRAASGEPIVLHHQTSTGGQWEAQQTISAASWRAIGIQTVDEYVIPQANRSDRETNNQYRGFNGSVVRFDTLTYIRQFLISECPTAANRWVGTNVGCYSEPNMDRVSNALLVTLNPTEQRQLWREWTMLFTRDLPALPIFHHVQGTIFRDGFTGFKGEARDGGGGFAWNAYEWDLSK
jgi:peptide/nickel transport system substrate-binding protein